jgi:AcrR family transcriptional regulator
MVNRDPKRAKTRDRILDAALDVFAEEGFAGATISEVERRVGLAVGTGSLYRHFSSKEELMQAAVEREVTLLREDMEAARAGLPRVADPREQRLQIYEQMLRDIRRFDRLFRLMLNEGDRVPELREAIWAAVSRPVPGNPSEEDAVDAVAMAALGGYHLFSLMQGRPFNGVTQERFLRTLVGITEAPVHPPADLPPDSRREIATKGHAPAG